MNTTSARLRRIRIVTIASAAVAGFLSMPVFQCVHVVFACHNCKSTWGRFYEKRPPTAHVIAEIGLPDRVQHSTFGEEWWYDRTDLVVIIDEHDQARGGLKASHMPPDGFHHVDRTAPTWSPTLRSLTQKKN